MTAAGRGGKTRAPDRASGKGPYIRASDGCRLHYEEAGAGTPVVLLHGWAQSGALFRKQLSGLAGRHRVIALDLRGHGESDKPLHGYRISRLAGDVRDFLAALGLQQVNLLGWSMGCAVIWSYLDLFGPERLERLVLVDQSASVLNRGDWNLGFLDSDQLFEQLTQIQADRSEWTRSFLDLITDGELPDEDRAWMLEENLKLPTEAAVTLLLNHCVSDWRDVVPRITLPTLVVGAKQSPVQLDAMHWIADRIPHAELAVLETGHLMFYEEPETFNELVSGFLAGDRAPALRAGRGPSAAPEGRAT